MDNQRQIVVITGASKGLGRELAIHLSQIGAHVILVARTAALLEQVQAEIGTITGELPMFVSCDVSSETDVSRMVECVASRYDHIDVLVNNAGMAIYRNVEKLSNQDMRKHFEVNFFGTYYCAKELLPLLKESTSGYILNIGSYFSELALADNSAYAASKFALAGFSEGIRRELKPFGIAVGLFLPGPMDTDFHKNQGNSVRFPNNPVMIDLKKASKAIGDMISRRKRKKVHYPWMMLALKVRHFC